MDYGCYASSLKMGAMWFLPKLWKFSCDKMVCLD